MTKLRNMRVIRIPKFRAVSSGPQTFEELFAGHGFDKWCGEHRELIKDLIYAPSDFLWHEGAPETYGHGLNVWIRAVNDGVSAGDVAPYALTEFPGGIFLVATADESDKSDLEETVSGMFDWIRENAVFEYGDFPPERHVQHARCGHGYRPGAGHSPAADIPAAEIQREIKKT